MTASYPASVKSFTTKVDFADTVLAEHVNSLQEEVNSIQANLGTNIKTGSGGVGNYDTVTTAWNTLKDRITNIEYGLTDVWGAVPVGGTTGQVLTVSGGVPSWVTPSGGATYAIFRDEKNSSTDGGTFTSGAFRTRDLNNTQINQISGASLASNQITLPAGTFYISAFLGVYGVLGNQARLQNITDSTTTIVGVSEYSVSGSPTSLEGVFTIAASKVFELQHRGENTISGYGFGIKNSFSDNFYTLITIAKVA